MHRDIRDTALYKEVENLYASFVQPGTNRISDADHIAASPDGQWLGFTGSVFADLATPPRTRVCVVVRDSGAVCRVFISHVEHDDKMPCWSPDSAQLAFLSDRRETGNYQLCLVGGDGTGNVIETPRVDGCVEALSWSPDGGRILLGVAEFGADLAGCQGGATIARHSSDLPTWIPEVNTGDADNLWRSCWLYDCETGALEQVNPVGLNVWESRWCGDEAVVAIVSDHHSEGSWYNARLVLMHLGGEPSTVLYQPQEQIGVPCASPDGQHLAVIEAICSDRMIVAGDIRLFSPTGGDTRPITLNTIDVTHIAWRDSESLAFAGHRGFETVTGEVNVHSGEIVEYWSSESCTIGAWYPAIAPLPATGGQAQCAALVEQFDRPPALTVISADGIEEILALANPGSDDDVIVPTVIEAIRWQGRDGLEIHGWLVRPEDQVDPGPLVVDIHGGPVWCCRNRWRGRLRGAQALANHRVATLYPNPRGSSARGQDFAAMVRGDMGGEDTYDYLAGIDAMVERGVADPGRVGVTGISYGGFMSSWLITQDDRFAAAAPISPVVNWYSQHGTSQIPFFDELFLGGNAREKDGNHYHRSPVMFADKVKCPTLTLVGALDQNTPPTQGLEFHNALLENGVESVLVTYPNAAHGIRNFPDVIDHTTRYVGWFLRHL